MRRKVFITTPDIQLALTLVRLLYQNGIDAFWVGEAEGERLQEVWEVGAWIRAN